MYETCRNCKNVRFVRTIDGTISESQKCSLDGWFLVSLAHSCHEWKKSDECQDRTVIYDRYLTNGYPSLDNGNFKR